MGAPAEIRQEIVSALRDVDHGSLPAFAGTHGVLASDVDQVLLAACREADSAAKAAGALSDIASLSPRDRCTGLASLCEAATNSGYHCTVTMQGVSLQFAALGRAIERGQQNCPAPDAVDDAVRKAMTLLVTVYGVSDATSLNQILGMRHPAYRLHACADWLMRPGEAERARLENARARFSVPY